MCLGQLTSFWTSSHPFRSTQYTNGTLATGILIIRDRLNNGLRTVL
jgi:hypothetical protein